MIRARRLSEVAPPPILTDPSIVGTYLEDASGAAPGSAAGLVRPSSEEEAAAFLRLAATRGLAVLPQAARSSLTGGAIPRGEVVVSVERLAESGPLETAPGAARQSWGPGVRLRELEAALAPRGYYYPPVPTYREAMLGGTVSTNAGGAATFKYGVTREWVHGLRVLLFNGDLLVLERGETQARPGESFAVGLSDGRELSVEVPCWRLPALRKISAGYHAADPLDLVDLFIGAEGTLGLITGVTVRLVPRPPAVLTALAFLDEPRAALGLAATLRGAAREARERRDPRGPDVRSIEWLDAGSLDLLRRDGSAVRRRIDLPATARSAVLLEMELAEATGAEVLEDQIATFLEPAGEIRDHALTRLLTILREHGALEHLEIAFPGDERRRGALVELREAVPLVVSEILAARRRADPGVHKVGGDLIVPFERLSEMIELYEAGFARRGIEHAVWGHLSDGNLHPNGLPRTAAEARSGVLALLDFAREAIERGGSPLSEHGVGRNPVKQEMLRLFLGQDAVAQMRRIKAALDPDGRFAPGVLFAPGS